tara:strand:- start:165 stop:809 length:645 start_codon:yes stop_codon:yes gene_type:complete
MAKITDINELLPDGLSEDTVEKIFSLVDSTINEQVEKQATILEARVNAYLRNKIDQIKEQAMVELAEESDLFRNAQLFESVRTLMSFELNKDDDATVVAGVTSELSELQEEFDVLLSQVTTLVEANDNLELTVTALQVKEQNISEEYNTLSEDKLLLAEQVVELEAALLEEFESSEKAVVISKADAPINEESEVVNNNSFLNAEVLHLMPKKES